MVKSIAIASHSDRMRLVRDFFVVDLSPLDGVSNNRLRNSCRGQGISVLAPKYSILRIALLDLGCVFDFSQGPNCVVWGVDAVLTAKCVVRWKKDFPGILVKGGLVQGCSLSAVDVEKLSECPTKEQLIASVLGGLLMASSAGLSAVMGPGPGVISQFLQLPALADVAAG